MESFKSSLLNGAVPEDARMTMFVNDLEDIIKKVAIVSDAAEFRFKKDRLIVRAVNDKNELMAELLIKPSWFREYVVNREVSVILNLNEISGILHNEFWLDIVSLVVRDVPQLIIDSDGKITRKSIMYEKSYTPIIPDLNIDYKVIVVLRTAKLRHFIKRLESKLVTFEYDGTFKINGYEFDVDNINVKGYTKATYRKEHLWYILSYVSFPPRIAIGFTKDAPLTIVSTRGHLTYSYYIVSA